MRLILLLAQTLSSLPSHQLVEVLGTIFQPPLRVMAVQAEAQEESRQTLAEQVPEDRAIMAEHKLILPMYL